MKLFEYVNEQEFIEMLNLKYITINEHPSGIGYKIINYSKLCNSLKIWNNTTMKCRGLIIDADNNIIARPFIKFFNYEEFENENDIPITENFKIFEKLDGSLGILYWIGDTPFIATKGSFESDQAKHATYILHTRYRDIWHKLNKNLTYLFEIIYPEDLHCVTYKDVNDIFLIGVLDTNNENKEYDINKYSNIFRITDEYKNISDWKNIRDLFSGDNREGFVIKFENNFRLKLKYEQYWKIHFLRSGFTEKRILECLCDNDYETINKAFELFDEEHKLFYEKILNKYTQLFTDIHTTCIREFKNDFKTRKDAAIYFNTCTYPNLMFTMYDNKNIDKAIWNLIKKIK